MCTISEVHGPQTHLKSNDQYKNPNGDEHEIDLVSDDDDDDEEEEYL
jgi:hypothetical protein